MKPFVRLGGSVGRAHLIAPILLGLGCSDSFDDRCQDGTVEVGTKCALVDTADGGSDAAAAGGAGFAAGMGGKPGSGGVAGGAGAGGGSAGGGKAGAGGPSSGAGAGGGAGGGGASGSGGGPGAGMGGAGLGGNGGAPGGGAAGVAGKGGASGASGAGSAGASGAGSGAGGTGGGGASGAGGSAAGGAGGSGAGTGGVSGGGMSGTGGGGGTCDPGQCQVPDCFTPTCGSDGCGMVAADAGAPCGNGGVCNGKGVCGECKPSTGGCTGNLPKVCSDDGTWLDASSPCEVECGGGACATVDALAAGHEHGCVLLSTGTVRCWGSANTFGELGVPATPASGTAHVEGLDGVTSLALGDYFGCGRRLDGTVWCWGSNLDGRLGQPGAVLSSHLPLQVPGIASATAVFAGPAASGACALLADKTLTCWGTGQAVEPVTGLVGVTMATVGEQFRCARTLVGKIWCWGRDFEGECATGTLAGPDLLTPTEAKLSGPYVLAGRRHACVHGFCWGADDYGQLGDGPPSKNSGSPVKVNLLSGAPSQIALGANTACAITPAGVACWGLTTAGTTTDHPVVLPDAGLPTQIAIGGSGSFGCGTYGATDVRCWSSAPATPIAW